MALRAIPNVTVLRPADATENAEAWKVALRRVDGPTVLVLSRQNLPILDRRKLAPAEGVSRGGYVLWEAEDRPQCILIGTGSEVHLAIEAALSLQENGIAARVVSLPSWELFDAQPEEYRASVLPPGISARVSVEASTPMGWERYVGLVGVAVGVPHFGASAPGEVVYEHLSLSARRVADEAKRLLSG